MIKEVFIWLVKEKAKAKENVKVKEGNIMSNGETHINNMNEELYHYGIPGMRLGVIRSNLKTFQNNRYDKKAFKYDKKSEKAYKKSEKIHAKKDLGRSNRAAKRSAKYFIKAIKNDKKASNEEGYTKQRYLAKAAKFNFKSTVKKAKANRLSKTTGYGIRAMAQSIRSDKFKIKAEKYRYKMAKNERYKAFQQTKIADLYDRSNANTRIKIEKIKEKLKQS